MQKASTSRIKGGTFKVKYNRESNETEFSPPQETGNQDVSSTLPRYPAPEPPGLSETQASQLRKLQQKVAEIHEQERGILLQQQQEAGAVCRSHTVVSKKKSLEDTKSWRSEDIGEINTVIIYCLL